MSKHEQGEPLWKSYVAFFSTLTFIAAAFLAAHVFGESPDPENEGMLPDPKYPHG